MFSKLHERLGTAGLVVAVIALVVALGGTAVAALNGSEKKEVKKIAKKFAGKNGKNGRNGKDGAPGAQGPGGPQGAPGAKGDAGAPGAAGAKGATGATGAAGPAGTTGTAGATGATGVTGTAGATGVTGATGPTCPEGHCYLPSKATETGSWGTIFMVPGAAYEQADFNLPLKAPLDTAHTVIIKGSSTAAEKEKCDDGAGTAASPTNPEADPGYFCVFVNAGTDANVSAVIDPGVGSGGASIAGALIEIQGAEFQGALGTWAVTAP